MIFRGSQSKRISSSMITLKICKKCFGDGARSRDELEPKPEFKEENWLRQINHAKITTKHLPQS